MKYCMEMTWYNPKSTRARDCDAATFKTTWVRVHTQNYDVLADIFCDRYRMPGGYVRWICGCNDEALDYYASCIMLLDFDLYFSHPLPKRCLELASIGYQEIKVTSTATSTSTTAPTTTRAGYQEIKVTSSATSTSTTASTTTRAENNVSLAGTVFQTQDVEKARQQLLNETALYLLIISLVMFLDVTVQFFVLKQMKTQPDIPADKKQNVGEASQPNEKQRSIEDVTPTRHIQDVQEMPAQKTQGSTRSNPPQLPTKKATEAKPVLAKETSIENKTTAGAVRKDKLPGPFPNELSKQDVVDLRKLRL